MPWERKRSTLRPSRGAVHRSRVPLIDSSAARTVLLFLNARHYAAGLNLPMTTHVIIYNSMSDNMRMQVIGRAQRMGRKSRAASHSTAE